MAAASSNEELSNILARLRTQINSKQENQKAPAQLLIAIEESLDESHKGAGSSSSIGSEERPAALYFLTLVEELLGKAVADQNSQSLLASVLYLLAIFTPHTSAGIIKERLSVLLPALIYVLSSPHGTTKAAPADAYAALLRSALTIFQALLSALSKDAQLLLSEPQLRECWDASLSLCADSRPKVRKLAQSSIAALLVGQDEDYTATRPHPYAPRVVAWTLRILASVASSGGLAKSKAAQSNKYDVKKGRAQGAGEAAKQRQVDLAGSSSVGIWICVFLKDIIGRLPEKYIPEMCEELLRLPGQQNPHLTVATFEVFEALYRPSKTSASTTTPVGALVALVDTQILGKTPASHTAPPSSLTKTLQAFTSSALKPSMSDTQMLPPYLRALEGAIVALSKYRDGADAWAMFPSIWTEVMEMSLSAKSDSSRSSSSVRTTGKETLLSFLRYCIPGDAVTEALAAPSPTTTLHRLIESVESAIGRHALRYTHSQPEILAILAAMITRLRVRSITGKTAKGPISASPPAATALLMPIIKQVAEMRQAPKYPHRDAADLVLGAATEVCGPEALLKELPLGLLGENGAGKEGRAWLLPLMRGRITNTKMAHFVNDIVPLSERLFNARAEAEKSKGRAVEAKVYEALIDQLWALFPGYCDLPVDLETAFTQKFAEMLCNVLSSQKSLRPSVLRGLTLLVERNEALSRSAAPDQTLQASFGLAQAVGKANVEHLTKMASAFLSVFSNLLTQSPSSSRGYITEALGAYLRILPASEVKATYTRICAMLESSLKELVPQRDREVGPNAVPPMAHSMLDLLVTMLPFLAVDDGRALLELASSDTLLRHEDAGVQKKTYRILARMIEGNRGENLLRSGAATTSSQTAEAAVALTLTQLLTKIREATVDVLPGAKRDRLSLLSALVPRIPSTDLHLLLSVIPETVLATKEANQVSRSTAYELLVQMGDKMEAGGTIKRGQFDEDNDYQGMKDESEVPATLTEYFTMVGAGLAGGSPHMISASITSFSRLMHEYSSRLPKETIDELLSTIEVFLSSPNREIVKSVLGFIKVTIVSLEDYALVDSHLDTIVPAMLAWSPEHRAHFKGKVRHIFERLIRRFGYERILALTDEENRKLVVNIKKRKDRAKRKKVAREGVAGDEDDMDNKGPGAGVRANKSHGVDAFEEALYGSESDISDSDDDDDMEDDDDNDNAGTRRGGGASGVELARKAAAARQIKGVGRPQANRQQQQNQQSASRRRRDASPDNYLLADDSSEIPMDLLDRSASAIASRLGPASGAAGSRKRKPGSEARRFDLDTETGRMVISDDSPSTAATATGSAAADVDAFGPTGALTSLSRGVDGHTTTASGQIKFNTNSKRARMEERQDEIEEMEAAAAAAAAAQRHSHSHTATSSRSGNGTGLGHGNKFPRKRELIGAAYRSSKASGDVRRSNNKSTSGNGSNSNDPYAYVPLGAVAGKKNKSGRRGGARDMEITGKGLGGRKMRR